MNVKVTGWFSCVRALNNTLSTTHHTQTLGHTGYPWVMGNPVCDTQSLPVTKRV